MTPGRFARLASLAAPAALLGAAAVRFHDYLLGGSVVSRDAGFFFVPLRERHGASPLCRRAAALERRFRRGALARREPERRRLLARHVARAGRRDDGALPPPRRPRPPPRLRRPSLARRLERSRARGGARPPLLGRLPDGAAPHHDHRLRRAAPPRARGARNARPVRCPGDAAASRPSQGSPSVSRFSEASRSSPRSGPPARGARARPRGDRRARRPGAARPRAPGRPRGGGAPLGGSRRRPAPSDGGRARALGPGLADARRGGGALLVGPAGAAPDAPRAAPDGRPGGGGRPRLLGRADVRRGQPLLPRPRPRPRPALSSPRPPWATRAAGPRSASRGWRRSCRSGGSSLRSERFSGRCRSSGTRRSGGSSRRSDCAARRPSESTGCATTRRRRDASPARRFSSPRSWPFPQFLALAAPEALASLLRAAGLAGDRHLGGTGRRAPGAAPPGGPRHRSPPRAPAAPREVGAAVPPDGRRDRRRALPARRRAPRDRLGSRRAAGLLHDASGGGRRPPWRRPAAGAFTSTARTTRRGRRPSHSNGAGSIRCGRSRERSSA